MTPMLSPMAAFLLTPLREGRPACRTYTTPPAVYFYSRPCGRGDLPGQPGRRQLSGHFYSRPCGRGDSLRASVLAAGASISTHAPAGGATRFCFRFFGSSHLFLLTPLREGRQQSRLPSPCWCRYFYSRPCGRGDRLSACVGLFHIHISTHAPAGGATSLGCNFGWASEISTHAPAGGATPRGYILVEARTFLLTPLREGRRSPLR